MIAPDPLPLLLEKTSARRTVLVLGAPGSGRTELAVATAAAAVRDGAEPERVTVLAADRAGAARLRERVARELSLEVGEVQARTPASLAFALARRAAIARGSGEVRLLSGADEDALLAEILAGYQAGIAPGPAWPSRFDPAAVALPGFRQELREVFAQAAEEGMSPPDLADLGRRRDVPEWVAAAHVYADELAVLELSARGALDAGPALDAARLVRSGAQAARDLRAAGLLEEPRWIIADDAQELGTAAIGLLAAVAGPATRTVLVADPDLAVQTFRGARPDLLARLPELGLGTPAVLELPAVHRHGRLLGAITAAVTERIGTTGPVGHRRAEAAEPDRPGRAEVLTAPTEERLVERVAHLLRERHRAGVGFDDMAVIARSAARLERLAQDLALAGFAVDYRTTQRPLRDERIVTDLLAVCRTAVGTAPAQAGLVEDWLLGPIGRADPLRVRRIRQELRRGARAHGGGAPDSDALLTAVLDPDDALLVEVAAAARPGTLRPLQRIVAMVRAARKAADDGQAADAVLWAAWDASRLAGVLRGATDGTGPAAARAHHALDVMIALFASAERFTDRSGRADVAAFADHVASQSLAEDTLAARGDRGPLVTLTTPAGAVGREWDTVVVTGVQDGVWPNLRPRTRLLRADEITGAPSRRAVLHDELRMFALAVSRPRSVLAVAAVDGDEETPSPLVDLVRRAIEHAGHAAPHEDPTAPGPRDAEAAVPDASAGAAETSQDVRTGVPSEVEEEMSGDGVRSLVARWRAEITAGGRYARGARAALAVLADAGVPGADEATWYGRPRTRPDGAAPGQQHPLRLSPSALDQLATCPLRWFLERCGGRPAPGTEQTLGTLLHAVAQREPHGDRERLQAAYDALRTPPEQPSWITRQADQRAADALDLLAAYLAVAGEPIAVEAPFHLRHGSGDTEVELNGTIDRIERRGEELHVVDFKTGRHARSADEVTEDRQLGAYQIAVRDGGLEAIGAHESAGAELVYIGTGSARPVLRAQVGLAGAENPRWMDEALDAAARTAAGPTYPAILNPGCDHCPVRRVCPARTEGEMLHLMPSPDANERRDS